MKRLVLLYLFLPALYLSFANSARAADLQVSFKTRRGNLLHATLSMPQSSFARVPAVVLLSTPRTARSRQQESASDLSDLAPIITNTGAAVLTLPSKQGNQPKTALSQSLDVRAAID